MKSRPIIAFVATQNAPRAKEFYMNTLKLPLVGEDNFAIVFEAGGTMLRVAIVQEHRPARYSVLGWIVSDIRQEVRKLMSRKVTFQRYGGLEQDELGIWKSPSGAGVAWFQDPDGNILSLTQFERRKKGARARRGMKSKSRRR